MKKLLLLMAAGLLVACDANTPLMEASVDGRNAKIQTMLDSGVDINHKNRYGWTALTHAARAGNIETAKLLMSKGALVDVADDTGWTPLLRAAQKGHVEMVKLLINNGANVNAATTDGWTALMWASLRGKLGVIKYLVRVKGIDVNHLSDDGRSAILIAITENNNDILIVLQDAGARP